MQEERWWGMSKKDEALKLAEDALKRVRTQDMELVQLSMIALAAIREALAEQPAPMIRGDIRDGLVDDEPAQSSKPWVGLTRAERFEIEKAMSKYYDYQHECKTVCLPEFARAIEAKLKEKNA